MNCYKLQLYQLQTASIYIGRISQAEKLKIINLTYTINTYSSAVGKAMTLHHTGQDHNGYSKLSHSDLKVPIHRSGGG